MLTCLRRLLVCFYNLDVKRKIAEVALGRTTPRVLRSGLHAEPQELRHELNETIESMQILTKLVKQDIQLVHRIVPLSDIKAKVNRRNS